MKAITLSPRLSLGSPVRHVREHCTYTFNTLYRSVDFLNIYPEFAEKDGRLHYHGILTIKDPIKWYKSTMPKLQKLGFCLVKDDVNENWVSGYMIKQSHIALAACGLTKCLDIKYIETIRMNFIKKQILRKGLRSEGIDHNIKSITDYYPPTPQISLVSPGISDPIIDGESGLNRTGTK